MKPKPQPQDSKPRVFKSAAEMAEAYGGYDWQWIGWFDNRPVLLIITCPTDHSSEIET